MADRSSSRAAVALKYRCVADEAEQRLALQELLAWMRRVELDMLADEQEAGRAAPTAAPPAQSEGTGWTPRILRPAR